MSADPPPLAEWSLSRIADALERIATVMEFRFVPTLEIPDDMNEARR